MQTREIPPATWGDYLQSLGNQKAQKLVRISVESEELGSQPLAENMPLVGISFEEKGSEANAIELTLGGPEKPDFTHMIQDPAHVWIEEDEAGQVRSMDIENAERVKTIIFFGEG